MAKPAPTNNLQRKLVPPLSLLRPADEKLDHRWQRPLIFGGLAGLIGLNQLGLNRAPSLAVFSNAFLLLLVSICCLKLPGARLALSGLLVILAVNCVAIGTSLAGINGQIAYVMVFLSLGLVYFYYCRSELDPLHKRTSAIWPTILGGLVGGSGFVLLRSSLVATPSIWILGIVSALASELVLRGLIQQYGSIYTNPKLAIVVSSSLGIVLASGQATIGRQILMAAGLHIIASYLYQRYNNLTLNLTYHLTVQLTLFTLLAIRSNLLLI